MFSPTDTVSSTFGAIQYSGSVVSSTSVRMPVDGMAWQMGLVVAKRVLGTLFCVVELSIDPDNRDRPDAFGGTDSLFAS